MDNGQKVKKDYIRRAKGLLLQCKRITFGGQKDSFYNAKGLHSEGKRTTFEKEKDFATSRGNNHNLVRKLSRSREEIKKAPETAWFRAQIIYSELVELSELVVRTEHVNDLVLVHLLHKIASRTTVLTWVELTWFVMEYLANSSCEGQT